MERSVRWLAVAIGALAVAIVAAALILNTGSGSPPTPAPATPVAGHATHCDRVGPRYARMPMEQDSMRPTLEPDDLLLIDLEFAEVARGDLVAFVPEPGGAALIKRAVGIGGDTIEIADGVVLLNGETLAEPYLLTSMTPVEDVRAWRVRGDSLFVMGDNRNNSTDSRSQTVGLVSLNDVIGLVVYRCAPTERRGPLP